MCHAVLRFAVACFAVLSYTVACCNPAWPVAALCQAEADGWCMTAVTCIPVL